MSDMDIPVGASVNWKQPSFSCLYPLVVPFVKNKASFFQGKIEPVYKNACCHIGQCQRLIVFGYGFSPSDEKVLELFKVHLSMSLPKPVVVIDLCEKKAGELQDLIGDRASVEWRKDVHSFLDNPPDASARSCGEGR